jgi:hypothetical protein
LVAKVRQDRMGSRRTLSREGQKHTAPQIAAITGHTLKDVEAILETHYLGGTIELAEAAITKLNAAYG